MQRYMCKWCWKWNFDIAGCLPASPHKSPLVSSSSSLTQINVLFSLSCFFFPKLLSMKKAIPLPHSIHHHRQNSTSRHKPWFGSSSCRTWYMKQIKLQVDFFYIRYAQPMGFWRKKNKAPNKQEHGFTKNVRKFDRSDTEITERINTCIYHQGS